MRYQAKGSAMFRSFCEKTWISGRRGRKFESCRPDFYGFFDHGMEAFETSELVQLSAFIAAIVQTNLLKILIFLRAATGWIRDGSR